MDIIHRLLRCKIIFNIANSLFACGLYANSEEICRFGTGLCDQSDYTGNENRLELLKFTIRFMYVSAVSVIVENSDLISIKDLDLASTKAQNILKAKALLKKSLSILEENFSNDKGQRYELLKMLQKANNLLGKYTAASLESPVPLNKRVFIKKRLELSETKVEAASQRRAEVCSANSSQNLSKISKSSKRIHRIIHNGCNSDRHYKQSKASSPKQVTKSSCFKIIKEPQKEAVIQIQEAETPRIGVKINKISQDNPAGFSSFIYDGLKLPVNNHIPPDTLKEINMQLAAPKSSGEISLHQVTMGNISPMHESFEINMSKIDGQTPPDSKKNKTSKFSKPSQEIFNNSAGDISQTMIKSGPNKVSIDNFSALATIKDLKSSPSNRTSRSDMRVSNKKTSRSNLSEDPSTFNKETTIPSLVNYRKKPDDIKAKIALSMLAFSRSNKPKLSVGTESAITGHPELSVNASRKNSHLTPIQQLVGSAIEINTTPRSTQSISQKGQPIFQEIGNMNNLTIHRYRSPAGHPVDSQYQLK